MRCANPESDAAAPCPHTARAVVGSGTKTEQLGRHDAIERIRAISLPVYSNSFCVCVC